MMKKLTFRPRLAIIAVAVCVLLGISIALLAFRPPVKSSSQSDYPVLKGPAMGIVAPYSFEDHVHAADLIVDATVEKVDPLETKVYTPGEGSVEQKLQEEKGAGSIVLEGYNVHLTVTDTVVGSCDSSEITLYIGSLRLGTVPDFQPGDRMIFFLSDRGNDYIFSSYEGSLYYVAFDDKVYPTYLTETLQRTSGQSLRSFKEEIRAIAQQEPQ